MLTATSFGPLVQAHLYKLFYFRFLIKISLKLGIFYVYNQYNKALPFFLFSTKTILAMKFRVIISLLLVFFLAQTCYGDALFSSLPRTLVVSASPLQGQVLKAGEDRITGKWGLNESLKASGVSLEYKNVKVSLCYAPVSQIDRGWRATKDNLKRDKTCQFTIANGNYDVSQTSQSFDWPIEKDIPSATYFVRVYAYNSTSEEVGFGQTTDASKISNLFEIQGISGNHVSFDIASICFSAFSLVSLFGFLLMEKRKNKRLSEN